MWGFTLGSKRLLEIVSNLELKPAYTDCWSDEIYLALTYQLARPEFELGAVGNVCYWSD